MSEAQVLTIADRRKLARTKWAPKLAGQTVTDMASGPVEEFTRKDAGGSRLSSRLCWFRSPGRLIVVAGPYEDAGDVDLALAHGLRYVKDDEVLVLVLPDNEAVTRPTLVRAPWIDPTLEIWSYNLAAAERDEGQIPKLMDRYSKADVLKAYGEPRPAGWGYDIEAPPRPPGYESYLGEKSLWVDSLTTWLTEQKSWLDAEHTNGYLAWKCSGKIVLKLNKTAKRLTISAGIQHRNHKDPARRPLVVECFGPLSAEKLSELKGRVEKGAAELPGGLADRYREHQLQGAILRLDTPILGLTGMLKSERGAWRPYLWPHGRAFLDFLGIDEKGTLRIIETKIGEDEMMVLQGLDYWIWATANMKSLSAHDFHVDHPSGVEVDFLVEKKGKEKVLGPYSGPQSRCALRRGHTPVLGDQGLGEWRSACIPPSRQCPISTSRFPVPREAGGRGVSVCLSILDRPRERATPR